MTREEDLPRGPDGGRWGTAEQLAALLGAHIRPDTIRTWARRKRVPTTLIPGRGRGTRLYPLAAAEDEERRTRHIGRPRATIALTVSAQ